MHDPEKKRVPAYSSLLSLGAGGGRNGQTGGRTEDKDMRNKRVVAYRQVDGPRVA